MLESAQRASATEIRLTGTNFGQMNAETTVAVFREVLSDSATIDSDTQITVTFNKGVPTTDTELPITLLYVEAGFPVSSGRRLNAEKSLGRTILAARSSNDPVFLTNPSAVDGSQTDLSCSFQGGCLYRVEGDGLASTLLASDRDVNKITVCDKTCEIDEASSDATGFSCRLPAHATKFSVQRYEIDSNVRSLLGDMTFSAEHADTSEANMALLTDKENYAKFNPGTCEIRGSFKAGHVGVLDKVKVFFHDMSDKDSFAKLSLQASNNDFYSMFALHQFDANVHSGWNEI